MKDPLSFPGRSVLLAVLAVLSAGCGAVESPSTDLLPGSTLVTCETDRVDVGDGTWRWALKHGFYFDERGRGGRSFAWTEQEATALLILKPGEARSLELSTRAFPKDLTVSVALNGTDLGERAVPRRWSTLTWELPPDRVRDGPNVLRLRSSTGGYRDAFARRLSIAVDRIEVQPVAGPSPDRCETLPARTAAEGLTMESGTVLVPGVRWSPSGRLHIDAEGPPGTELTVLYSGERFSDEDLAIDSSGRLVKTVELADCCRPDAYLALRVDGPGDVRWRSLQLSGDERPSAWRRVCGAGLGGGVTMLVFLAVLIALATGRPRLPFARWAPWLDVVLLVGLAVVVRWVFLFQYPAPGSSGDEYEYMFRARSLAHGYTSFWQDTTWHAWQTWIRPPGYYLFLAGVLGPLKESVGTVLGLQALFSAVVTGTTYLAAYWLFGRRAALVAGFLFATSVESIVTFSSVFPETLYMLFLGPALAALAKVCSSPSWRFAAVAGVLFGLAALVRSAPIHYVPLAAGLLLVIHGWRSALRPAAVLVGSMILVILPWCVRNSLLYGKVMGVDDVATANLLQVAPNDRFVPASDLDLDTEEGFEEYYSRLQNANGDRQLTLRSSEILRATLIQLASHPLRTLENFGDNLSDYFSLFPLRHVGYIHREPRMNRVVLLTDLMNFQYLLLAVLGVAGFLLTLRDRRGWPLALWFVFNAVIVNLLFHPEYRYRFPTVPVLMVFAGAALGRMGAERSPDGKRSAVDP